MEENQSIITVILASAGTAALVSSLFTLMGQYFERRFRKKETLLQGALSLASRKTDLALAAAKNNNQFAELLDEAHLTAVYYKELRHLMSKGDLSEEFKNLEGQSAEMTRKSS